MFNIFKKKQKTVLPSLKKPIPMPKIKTKEKCEYCEPSEWDRKPLMINNKGNYYVVINNCNYLEDSVVGNSVEYSLFGKKIRFCPMCGREL